MGSLSDVEQESIAAGVGLLEDHGPQLGYPYSSAIAASRHGHMRELRIQHQGRPYRILYAFDPRRAAILLIGGDKTGNERRYVEFVPMADALRRSLGHVEARGVDLKCRRSFAT